MDPSFTTLEDVQVYIALLVEDLDPHSRYIAELLDIVEHVEDVDDLQARLKRGCRGRRFSTPEIFDRMTLADQLRANLITNETQVYRFEDDEARVVLDALQLYGRRLDRPVRILVAPCSHGPEAFTLSSLALSAGVSVQIDAWDIQPACIASAREGVLVSGLPTEHLTQPAIVAPSVIEAIDFQVRDLLAWAASDHDQRWDVIQCRNFLGYFQDWKAQHLMRALTRALSSNGLLVLDPFVRKRFQWLEEKLENSNFHQRGPAAWERGN